ncbi:hypothetical protein ACXEO8_24365 [Cytobacillus firmus]
MTESKKLSDSIKEKDQAFDNEMARYDNEIMELKKKLLNEKES